MDVANAGGQHGDAQVGDHLALVGVGHFAAADNAVLFAANGADFGLNGDALLVGDADNLLGLLDVLLNAVVGAVEHNGGEAVLHGLQGGVIGAVVQVQGNGDRDVQGLEHAVDHAGHRVEAAHILASALGHAEDNRGIALLGGEQDSLGPLQVVDVELANSVLAGLGLGEHFFCGN